MQLRLKPALRWFEALSSLMYSTYCMLDRRKNGEQQSRKRWPSGTSWKLRGPRWNFHQGKQLCWGGEKFEVTKHLLLFVLYNMASWSSVRKAKDLTGYEFSQLLGWKIKRLLDRCNKAKKENKWLHSTQGIKCKSNTTSNNAWHFCSLIPSRNTTHVLSTVDLNFSRT